MAQYVKEFVNITQNYSCEILLKSGKYVVDAKSILGIFSLDLSLPVTVEIYETEEKLTRVRDQFFRALDALQKTDRICVVNAARSIEEIHEEIAALVETIF